MLSSPPVFRCSPPWPWSRSASAKRSPATCLRAEVLGALIINRDNLAAPFRGFKTAYQGAFDTVTPMWDRVATLVPSTSAAEDYGWLGALPQLREWIGDRHVKSLEAFGYTIKNKPFEASVGIGRDEYEDDKYGLYANTFAQMGNNAASHPDTLVFPLLAATSFSAG